MTEATTQGNPSISNQTVDLEDMVIENDTGARRPSGVAATFLLATALAWSLFQLWIASPLPFALGIFVLDDTKVRYVHLAFALLLGFLAYPAHRKSPREYIPLMDWVLAFTAAGSALYLFVFYQELSNRSGIPTTTDIAAAVVGIGLLLEATRRALGPPLMIIAIIFLTYTFAGPYMPEIIRHGGQSLAKVSSHQWLTTEGVFGIAVGVSASYVFLFVLFGSLLEKAGAGNYFIKVAFSLLGHFRGGPAKAAVLSSGMTGLISGSSIANVVTTGTFTVPLMRRVGFSREKAGAVEVASSVNGQIMPPVMGAAAFLMTEYVSIPYIQVVKHAFLPALISYIALLYMVHLEALKADMQALPKPIQRTFYQRILVFGITIASIVLVCSGTYYAISWIKDILGQDALPVVIGLVAVSYIALLFYKSRFPELEMDDPTAPVVELPETGATVKTGLHYLLPIVVLVWCLMVERLSPGLSAFWASAAMIFVLLTQRPILAFFRKEGAWLSAAKQGFMDLVDGLITGARNMIGIGIATAAAGVIVGTVSLTGVGQVLTELVEVISGGSVILMLVFTAFICLILGMGLPTTANYIVVSSLMAQVVVELGAQNGLFVPLIAVHLFVFYFGIMADVTPPVGLASFAAAAVSGGDPIRTGIQAFFYSTRTVILPFLFIFNTDLLLIGVESFGHGVLIFLQATAAILLFSAATQGYFIVKSKPLESIALLLISITLFVPKFWIDLIIPPYVEEPAVTIERVLEELPEGTEVRLHIDGLDELGDPKPFVTLMHVPAGNTAEEKLKAFGMQLDFDRGKVFIGSTAYNSPARKAGLDFDFEITALEVPQEQPQKYIMYIPALILLFFIVTFQKGRTKRVMSISSTTLGERA